MTYWLVADSRPGLRMGVHPRAGLRAPAINAGSFDFTVQQKERSIYFAALRNGDAENWFGQMVSNAPSDLVFDVSNVDRERRGRDRDVHSGRHGRRPATDHVVAVAVNGTDVGELRFDGAVLGVEALRFRQAR